MRNRLELVTGRGSVRTADQTPRPVLRPANPDDAPRLVAMFERCSPETRYARFMAPLQHFPASHLVDVVKSSRTRRSWVIEDVASGQVVGVGSWFRNELDAAEVGLLVEDAFQHQGLGTALLDELVASALDEGITTFVGHTLADARHVHRMLRDLGPTTIEGRGTSRTLRTCLDDDAALGSLCQFA
jgi:RimJ/RimL family protein N-acetyltransferase